MNSPIRENVVRGAACIGGLLALVAMIMTPTSSSYLYDLETGGSSIGAATWTVGSSCEGLVDHPHLQTLTGTDESDTLAPSEENGHWAHIIIGLGGTDTLSGGNQHDCLDGGPGNDNVGGFNVHNEHENGNDYMFGGAGDDTISGGTGTDSLFGGADDDHISGGNGPDRIDGGTHTEGGGDTCVVQDIDTVLNCENIVVVPSDPDAGPGNGKKNKDAHLVPLEDDPNLVPLEDGAKDESGLTEKREQSVEKPTEAPQPGASGSEVGDESGATAGSEGDGQSGSEPGPSGDGEIGEQEPTQAAP